MAHTSRSIFSILTVLTGHEFPDSSGHEFPDLCGHEFPDLSGHKFQDFDRALNPRRAQKSRVCSAGYLLGSHGLNSIQWARFLRQQAHSFFVVRWAQNPRQILCCTDFEVSGRTVGDKYSDSLLLKMTVVISKNFSFMS